MTIPILIIIIMLIITVLIQLLWFKRLVWVNWAGNQRCYPEHIFYPQNLAQLITWVQKAAKNNKTIRVFGGSHSWSDLVNTTSYLINIGSLNKILWLDKENYVIKVEAGITLRHLNFLLAQEGLALSNQSLIIEQSLAGAIATATHGSGKTGTLSSFVQEIELLDAQGIMHILNIADGDIFAAARAHLGSLGIVYAVTLSCEPIFYLKRTREVTYWSTLKDSYLSLLQNNDHVTLVWNPYTDKVLLELCNRVNQKLVFSRRYRAFLEKLITGPLIGSMLIYCFQFFPRSIPTSINLLYTLLAKKTDQNECYLLLAASYTGLKRFEEEIALPQELLPKVFVKLNTLLTFYAQKNLYTLEGVLCRFVKADKNVLLSPTLGYNVVYISISTTPSKKYEPLYRDFENMLLTYGGRPHWGKINFLDYNKAHALYGENLEKFIKIKQKFDPKNVFSNNFTKRIFNKFV